MRYFILERNEDETGLSGTGIIAEGIVWSDGTVAYRWLTSTPTTVIIENVENVETIHGHDGKTILKFLTSWKDFPNLGVKENDK